MSASPIRLDDDLIRRTLIARAGTHDAQLLTAIRRGSEALPQRRRRWWEREPAPGRAVLAVALLLLLLAAAAIVGSRLVRPTPILHQNGDFLVTGQECALTTLDLATG